MKMMKRISLLILLAYSALAGASSLSPSERWQKAMSTKLKTQASMPETLSCMTGFATTTTMFEKTSSGGYRLQIFHHNGEKWGPIHKGVITTNDLPTLEKKALQLLKLGQAYEVYYEANECRALGASEFVCYHQNAPEGEWLGELKIKGHSFHVSTESAVSFGQVYENFETRFSVTTNQDLPYTTSYDVVMDYALTDCLYR